MITTTMDYKEISRAVEQDWKNELMYKAGTCFGMKRKYERYIMKNVGRDEFCFLGKRYYTTKALNKYGFSFMVKGKHDFKKNDILVSIWLEYFRRDGRHVVHFIPFSNPFQTIFFTPHCLERYRDRFLTKEYPDEEWPMDAVIEEMSITSMMAQMRRIPNSKYDYSIYATFEDGVLLGSWVEDNIIEYRTFISFGMLRSDQQKLSEQDKQGLKNMKEREKKGNLHMHQFTPAIFSDVFMDENLSGKEDEDVLDILDSLLSLESYD